MLQQDGAIVVAQRNAREAIVGEKLPVAVPERVFDREMTITLGGETVELHHIAHVNPTILSMSGHLESRSGTLRLQQGCQFLN